MTSSPKTLQSYKNKIKWTTERNLPMMQGSLINELISRYGIPAIAWGYDGSLIGIETRKQYLIWRDKGGMAEFKGIINKE